MLKKKVNLECSIWPDIATFEGQILFWKTSPKKNALSGPMV